MDGLLIIDKPPGITSHDVVARVRRILGTRRVGHTGTLDPFATGVLVLLIGNATRMAQFVDKDEKEYVALVRFGFETDTGDKTGLRIADRGLPSGELSDKLASPDWEHVFAKFRGDIMQTPPMYSAKKIDGKKLYELARAGVEVARKAVQINIAEIEALHSDADDPEHTLRMRVVCSAGTYIRTLAEDIGREVGTGAHLVELRRTRAGRFRLEDAVTLDELETAAEPDAFLRPTYEAVDHLPPVRLSADRAAATRNGLASRIDGKPFPPSSFVRLLDENSNLIAIGTYNDHEKTVKPKIVLV